MEGLDLAKGPKEFLHLLILEVVRETSYKDLVGSVWDVVLYNLHVVLHNLRHLERLVDLPLLVVVGSPDLESPLPRERRPVQSAAGCSDPDVGELDESEAAVVVDVHIEDLPVRGRGSSGHLVVDYIVKVVEEIVLLGSGG